MRRCWARGRHSTGAHGSSLRRPWSPIWTPAGAPAALRRPCGRAGQHPRHLGVAPTCGNARRRSNMVRSDPAGKVRQDPRDTRPPLLRPARQARAGGRAWRAPQRPRQPRGRGRSSGSHRGAPLGGENRVRGPRGRCDGGDAGPEELDTCAPASTETGETGPAGGGHLRKSKSVRLSSPNG